jgi:hypothetical protein
MAAEFLSTSFLSATFNGRSGAGTVSVPGVKSGDVIISTTAGGHAILSQFVVIIANDDEIEQLSTGDATSDTFVVFLMRSAAA